MAPAALGTIEVGGYVNPWKIVPIVVVLLVWARLLTWIDKDAKPSHLPRQLINSLMFAGLVLGYVLFFVVPGFAAAMAALCILLAVDLGVYLFLRAQRVGLSDLTGKLKSFQGRMLKKSEEKETVAAAGQLVLLTKSGGAQH
ncbi:MAG: hypothetical protein ABSF29_13450, partial [Tepidisphaeraceae bacterium]